MLETRATGRPASAAPLCVGCQLPVSAPSCLSHLHHLGRSALLPVMEYIARVTSHSCLCPLSPQCLMLTDPPASSECRFNYFGQIQRASPSSLACSFYLPSLKFLPVSWWPSLSLREIQVSACSLTPCEQASCAEGSGWREEMMKWLSPCDWVFMGQPLPRPLSYRQELSFPEQWDCVHPQGTVTHTFGLVSLLPSAIRKLRVRSWL